MSLWDVDPATIQAISNSNDPQESLEKWRNDVIKQCSSVVPEVLNDSQDMLNVMRELADKTEAMLQKKAVKGGSLTPEDKALMDLTSKALQYFHIKDELDL